MKDIAITITFGSHHNTITITKKILAAANARILPALTTSTFIKWLHFLVHNNIFNRKEHNVAVLQMKTSLQFSHNSLYSPICLPKSCLETCETWGGKTEQELLGTDAYSKKFQDGTTQNLAIIDNAECTEELNSWAARKVKRLISNNYWGSLLLFASDLILMFPFSVIICVLHLEMRQAESVIW